MMAISQSLTFYADTSITGSTLTGATNALGAPDGTSTTLTGINNWQWRWGMANPAAGTQVSGTHTITVWAKKEAGQSGTPSMVVDVYQNGTAIASGVISTSVTATTPTDYSGTFNSALITDTSTVEVYISVTAAGGSPSTRTTIQVDAISWSGTFVTPEAFTHSIGPDSIGITDVVDVVHEIGQSHVRGYQATMELSDQQSMSVGRGIEQTDAEGLADSRAFQVGLGRTDSINLQEERLIEEAHNRLREDTEQIIDVAAKQQGKGLGSHTNLYDNDLTILRGRNQAESDTEQIEDSLSAVRTLNRTQEDAESITDEAGTMKARGSGTWFITHRRKVGGM